jgi:hypothetical protein
MIHSFITGSDMMFGSPSGQVEIMMALEEKFQLTLDEEGKQAFHTGQRLGLV